MSVARAAPLWLTRLLHAGAPGSPGLALTRPRATACFPVIAEEEGHCAALGVIQELPVFCHGDEGISQRFQGRRQNVWRGNAGASELQSAGNERGGLLLKVLRKVGDGMGNAA